MFMHFLAHIIEIITPYLTNTATNQHQIFVANRGKRRQQA